MADKVLKEKRKLFVHSVSKGTINGLLDELLEKRVLNQEEMEKIRDENATAMDKARVLIDIVICKGPRACQICISHICEEDSHLAGIMGLTSGSQSGNYLRQESQAVVPPFPAPQAVQDNPVNLASSGPGGNLKLCPPETAQRIWKEKSGEIYPIMERSNRTRLALIICNTEFENLPKRDGADVDTRNMKMLLEGLGYNVDVKENLTALEMTLELKAFAARSEHQTSDSTFLVLMSHGIRAGICGKKYSEEVPDLLKIDDIFQIFNTWNCPTLKDKPKVIIIQACRGEKLGVVWVNDSVEASGNCSLVAPEDFEADAIKKAHIEKDFIAFCSSTPVVGIVTALVLGLTLLITMILAVVFRRRNSKRDYTGCNTSENVSPVKQVSRKSPSDTEGLVKSLPSGSHQGPVIYAQLDHSGRHHIYRINKSESVVYADIRKN